METKRIRCLLFDCPVDGCGTTTWYYEQLRLHMVEVHGSTSGFEKVPRFTYWCHMPDCDAVYSSRSELIGHFSDAHPMEGELDPMQRLSVEMEHMDPANTGGERY